MNTSTTAPNGRSRLALALKRLLDVSASIAGLTLLSPVLLGIAALVRVTMGRPVLFKQLRPGLGGEPFTLLKFRTMRHSTDSEGRSHPDEARITRIGRFLRSSSLDELPELFNVLRGDMSLVGPRPLLPEYLELYTPEQRRRHEMLPGITGPAQARGRNSITWEEKFELDIAYVDNWSLRSDVGILFKSIWKVITREGISADGHATMPRFGGSAHSIAPDELKRQEVSDGHQRSIHERGAAG